MKSTNVKEQLEVVCNLLHAKKVLLLTDNGISVVYDTTEEDANKVSIGRHTINVTDLEMTKRNNRAE